MQKDLHAPSTRYRTDVIVQFHAQVALFPPLPHNEKVSRSLHGPPEPVWTF